MCFGFGVLDVCGWGLVCRLDLGRVVFMYFGWLVVLVCLRILWFGWFGFVGWCWFICWWGSVVFRVRTWLLWFVCLAVARFGVVEFRDFGLVLGLIVVLVWREVCCAACCGFVYLVLNCEFVDAVWFVVIVFD